MVDGGKDCERVGSGDERAGRDQSSHVEADEDGGGTEADRGQGTHQGSLSKIEFWTQQAD